MTDGTDNKAPEQTPEATPEKEVKAKKVVKAPKATTKKAKDTLSERSDAPQNDKAEATENADAAAPEAPKSEAKKKNAKTGESGEVPAAEASSPAKAAAEMPKKAVETAASLLADDIGNLQIRRAKGSKNVTSGICHVLATFNNTLITFTDKAGNTISRSSSGKCGFKGAKKSTAYAAQVVCQDAAKVAMSHGLKEVEIRLCGPGMGRDSAVRAIQTLGLGVSSLMDVTPVPHNGCRPRKRRRV